MRRVAVAAVALVCWLSLALIWPGEAMAQGFFESLFGGGQQQAAPPPPMSTPPPLYGQRLPSNTGRDRSEGQSEQAQKSGSGRYRTLCVRTCDGYYFPVSNATTRQGFYKDAKICKASCGEEAKLYYLDKNDTDMSDMVDLTGRPYPRLQTAFLYRKRQIEGCKCKPDPWAQSELDRHRAYADASNAGKDEAKRKVQAGPSDPAVRAVFERQEKGSKTAVTTTAEAQTAEIASEPSNKTASEAGNKPTKTSNGTGGEPDAGSSASETAPANDTPTSDAAPAPANGATSSDSDSSKTPASPASEPHKSAPKSKPPSVKPDKRAPYHAGAPGSARSAGASAGARAPVVPASAQQGYAQPAPKSLFGLGGPSQRWPGE